MAKYYRRYGKRPVRRYAKKTVARKTAVKQSTKVTRPFAIKVKKVIHRMSENKFWQAPVVQNTVIPAAITGSTSLTSVNPYCINLLPQLAQGTGNSNRIGNRVRLVKNVVKGYVNLLPYNATLNSYRCPVAVKLYVFSVKSFTNFIGEMGLQNWQQFFRLNNADTGFYGTMLDMVQSINTELYTLHATRTFELSSQPFLVGGGGSNAGYGNPSGKWSIPFAFNLIKYVKDLKYDDNTSLRVTNKSLFLAAQVCYADGGTNSYVTPDQLVEIHHIQECEFEDL